MIRSQLLSRLKSQKTNWTLEAARAWRSLRERRIPFGLLFATLLRAIHRRRPSRHSSAVEAPRRILVIRLDAMGDLVMSTLIFKELKSRYPGASVTAVIQKGNRDLLETNPYIDRILHPPVIHKSRLLQRVRRECSIIRFYWTQLRKEHFDVALQPRLGPDFYEANLLLKLVDAPVSLKYVDRAKKGLAGKIANAAFRSMTNLPERKAQHEVLSNAALIEHLTGHRCTSQPEIFITADDREYAERMIANIESGSTIICIAFGAQAMKRSWPLERWAEVIRLLAEDREIFALLICSKAEQGEGERLQSMLNVESRLVSGSRLREAAACIEICDLFMGTDSGLAHLASAVGCLPLVVSPHPAKGDSGHGNSPVRFRPWSERARVIQPDSGSPPCQMGCDAIEPHCILQITPEQVARSCDTMLLSVRRVEQLNTRPVEVNEGAWKA